MPRWSMAVVGEAKSIREVAAGLVAGGGGERHGRVAEPGAGELEHRSHSHGSSAPDCAPDRCAVFFCRAGAIVAGMSATRTESDSLRARSRSRPTGSGARRRSAGSRTSASARSACRCRWSARSARSSAPRRGSTRGSACSSRGWPRPSPRPRDEVAEGRLDDAFPAGRLADRLGHPDQHERQRGDRQPRHPAARRRARQQGSGPSERPRQPEPVVERHLPHRDPRRRRAGDRPASCCPRCARLRDARGQGGGVGRASSRSAAPTCRTRRR